MHPAEKALAVNDAASFDPDSDPAAASFCFLENNGKALFQSLNYLNNHGGVQKPLMLLYTEVKILKSRTFIKSSNGGPHHSEYPRLRNLISLWFLSRKSPKNHEKRGFRGTCRNTHGYM